MKKWIAMLLALVTLLLCGCSGEGGQEETTASVQAETTVPVETTLPQETEAPDMQIVELTAWVTSENIWADQDTLNAMMEEFNAYYPNIVVNVEHKTPDQIGEEKPDIVLGNTDDLALWAAEGGMADMSAIWEGLQEDVYSTAEAVCGNEAGYFTVPMCVVPYCMAINAQLFEQAQAMGLLNAANHTWSTSNFIQACENLYDTGMENALNIYCMDTEGDVYTRLLVENLYGAAYVNTINGSYTAETTQMSNALTALKKGLGIKFEPDMDAAASQEKFLNGESAMTLNWSSALQLQHIEEENIFFMLYPANGKTKTYAEVYGLSVFDNGDATRLAASMTFVSHMSNSDAAVRATGQLPARKSAAEAYVGTELEEVMDDLSGLLNYMVAGETPGNCWEDARDQWVKMLQRVASGTNIVYCTQVCQMSMKTILENAGY